MAKPTDRYGNPIDKENLDLYDDEDIYETDEKGFVLLPKRLKKGLEKRVYKNPIDQANQDWGFTKRYKRKSDGKTFLLYPGTPNNLFSIEDNTGNSDLLLKDGQLERDFEFLDQEWEEQ